jgi:hypothetical protein
MKIFGYTIAQIRKTVLVAAGFVVAVLTAATPFVPEQYQTWVIGGIGIATSISVFIVKNAPLEPVPE